MRRRSIRCYGEHSPSLTPCTRASSASFPAFNCSRSVDSRSRHSACSCQSAMRISSPPLLATCARPRLLATPRKACALAQLFPVRARAIAFDIAHAVLRIVQTLAHELAFEFLAHAQRGQLVQHAGIEHAFETCRHLHRGCRRRQLPGAHCQIGQGVEQLGRHDRLGQKRTRAGLFAGANRFGRHVGAEHHHWRVAHATGLHHPQLLEHVQAVHARHVQIHNHRVVILFGHRIEHLLGAVDAQHLMPSLL